MVPVFAPQLVSNDGVAVLRAAIASPTRYAIEPKVDGVRALLTFGPKGIEVRGRKGLLRSFWLACRELRAALVALADRLPILREGSTVDGELWAGSFHRTMALLSGTRPFEPGLSLVVFDLPALGGVDLRRPAGEEDGDTEDDRDPLRLTPCPLAARARHHHDRIEQPDDRDEQAEQRRLDD
jgi:hypothetical protein